MKTTRCDFLVVLVNHFVIAIAGYIQSDGSLSTLSTIEVLDTQHNSQDDASTLMKHGRGGIVARFLKETNKIIIDGGINIKDFQATELNTVDSIHFGKN